MKIVRTGINKISRRINNYYKHLQQYTFIAFLIRIAESLGKADAGDMAAGIAYYAVLSIFPLVLGVIALLGLFLPSETLQTHIMDFSRQYIPGSVQLIQDNVDSVIHLRGTLGIISVIGLFWTSGAFFEALGRVMNKAWKVTVQKPFFIRKARVLLMSLGTGILFLLSMAASTISSLLPKIDLPVLESLSGIVVRIAGFLLLYVVFALLFKLVPNTKTYWRYTWLGALITAILFEIARSAFTFYLANFARYDKVYGSLAAFIILLVWIYFSAFILIIGTEFTAEYSRLRYQPKN